MWIVSAYVQWDTNTVGRRWMGISLNGTGVDHMGISQLPLTWSRNGSTVGLEQRVSAQIDLVDGQVVGICAYQDSGGVRTIVLAYLEMLFIKN